MVGTRRALCRKGPSATEYSKPIVVSGGKNDADPLQVTFKDDTTKELSDLTVGGFNKLQHGRKQHEMQPLTHR